jgi:hypothetical protein
VFSNPKKKGFGLFYKGKYFLWVTEERDFTFNDFDL